MHLRNGCKSLAVLKSTQKHAEGVQIQQGSWNHLQTQLPCSACIAGKMRKSRKNSTKEYTEMTNLALSWTANTEEKETRPNQCVSLDWGTSIIHKRYLKDKTMSSHYTWIQMLASSSLIILLRALDKQGHISWLTSSDTVHLNK